MPISSYLRPRFSLRFLLVLMTLLCLWCGYSVNWMRQRREALDADDIDVGSMSVGEWMNGAPRAPGMLWLFGEEGYVRISVAENVEWEPLQQRLAALFPEAEIVRGK
jgi:hypothetical protein